MANTKKTDSTYEAKNGSVDTAARTIKTKVPSAREIDPHQYIVVRNGTIGKLIYISPRTGEQFEWEEFGDAQEMELQELRNARAANKKFFERNWFMFDDEFDWVIDYLGVRAFYRHAIGIDNFDDLFQKKHAEIKKILSEISDGQKLSVSYRARQLISEGKIDSMKVIDVLENGLGVELKER